MPNNKYLQKKDITIQFPDLQTLREFLLDMSNTYTRNEISKLLNISTTNLRELFNLAGVVLPQGRPKSKGVVFQNDIKPVEVNIQQWLANRNS